MVHPARGESPQNLGLGRLMTKQHRRLARMGGPFKAVWFGQILGRHQPRPAS